MSPLEYIWGYLHDNSKCVNPNLFVTDTYTYASRLIDLLTVNPEVIPFLKERIAREKKGSIKFFSDARGGYGLTELRIAKLMNLNGIGDYFVEQFNEIESSHEDEKGKTR